MGALLFMTVVLVVIILAVILGIKTIVLIPRGAAAVIERHGSYTRTASGGITLLVPFVDRVRARVDTRERAAIFPPQTVITQDDATVTIDMVVTFQINDPAQAIYAADNYIAGVERTSTETLRDVVTSMTLEETLISQEVISQRLCDELNATTAKWGLRISRVELKAINPLPSA